MEVTRTLARFLVSAGPEDVPAPVRKECVRTLLNWVGVAVGGSRHPAVENAVAAISPFAGPPQARLLGRTERWDILNAALVNGISSHVFDFDDTHLKTVIHPSGPVVSPVLALAEYLPVSGREFLHAVTLGIETACRAGNAVYPDHYEAGWHITGTAGSIGAAAAAGILLRLDELQMTWALGLAASQPVGLRESFGSMNKSFNPGRAGQNGLTAALLASRNFTSSRRMLEAKRGWGRTISTRHDFLEITGELGRRWEISLNTYKPFACGIVIHPAIDACIQLRKEHGLTADRIDRIVLKVHPLVLELTGKKEPDEGLEGKFSVYHAAAVAIVSGKAGEKEFGDRAVRDPAVVALRGRVTALADPFLKEDQVEATVVLRDGSELRKFVEHAVGSVERPMTDGDLEAKFADLVEGILDSRRTRDLVEACWGVESLSRAATLAETAVPR